MALAKQVKKSSKTSFDRKVEKPIDVVVDACVANNETPNAARIAAIDYILNGSRARAGTGGFVGIFLSYLL